MNVAVVLVGVAAVVCVLDAAPAERKEEDFKRGGVASSLHGNFYRSLHQPMFARRSFDEKQDKQKKVTSKDKKFVDILGTSWASTETDPWGQSDPWGNTWGDPWGDSYSYYYVPWPRLNKRVNGAKTNAKKSLVTNVKDKKTETRTAVKNQKNKKSYDPWSNNNGYGLDAVGYDPWGNPLSNNYGGYYQSTNFNGYIPDAFGYDPWGNPLGKKHKRGLKKALKNKKGHPLKNKKNLDKKATAADKKSWYYQYYGGYYPNSIDHIIPDPDPLYYYYYYYYDQAQDKKALPNTNKADKMKRKAISDGTKKESQLISAIKRFMDESDETVKK